MTRRELFLLPQLLLLVLLYYCAMHWNSHIVIKTVLNGNYYPQAHLLKLALLSHPLPSVGIARCSHGLHAVVTHFGQLFYKPGPTLANRLRESMSRDLSQRVGRKGVKVGESRANPLGTLGIKMRTTGGFFTTQTSG
ncbi:hypothetical protein F4776DRAFT_175489 [Hypoxylon sp. NC0597]|nr:hypothetical protein F4776DRAFT_175489 [Hypoxylon sp. NC0597]